MCTTNLETCIVIWETSHCWGAHIDQQLICRLNLWCSSSWTCSHMNWHIKPVQAILPTVPVNTICYGNQTTAPSQKAQESKNSSYVFEIIANDNTLRFSFWEVDKVLALINWCQCRLLGSRAHVHHMHAVRPYIDRGMCWQHDAGLSLYGLCVLPCFDQSWWIYFSRLTELPRIDIGSTDQPWDPVISDFNLGGTW